MRYSVTRTLLWSTWATWTFVCCPNTHLREGGQSSVSVSQEDIPTTGASCPLPVCQPSLLWVGGSRTLTGRCSLKPLYDQQLTTSKKSATSNQGSTLTYRGDSVKKDTTTPQPAKNGSSFWKTKPVISYFLTEFPDAKSRKLFASAQLDIWAVEALCNLVAASFREDNYGVVQKTLPQILTSVIKLQENVEKHLKLVSSGRRNGGRGSLDLPLKYVLHSSLKSCIYRIINVFGAHLLNLDLPSDTSYKLKLFMDFKEWQ